MPCVACVEPSPDSIGLSKPPWTPKDTPTRRRAPSWRAVPCASRSSRGPPTVHPALTADSRASLPATGCAGRNPGCPAMLGGAQGPHSTNPPSMAGPSGSARESLRPWRAPSRKTKADGATKQPTMDGGFVHRGPLRSAEHRRALRVSAPKGSRPGIAASRPRAQDAHSADPLGDREAQGTARQEGARRTAGGVLEVQEALHKQGLLLAPRKRRETLCRLRRQNNLALKTPAARSRRGGRAQARSYR
jgi:hypothetical protein